MGKMILYRYKAYSYDKPEDIYKYARENGTCESVWVYNDVMEALKALPGFETTCELKQGNEPYWDIVCYALEPEEGAI